MKKLFTSFILSLLILVTSCTDESKITEPNQPAEIEGKIYFFNGLGDIGTLSMIDSTVSNNIISLGKWPNDIKYYDDKLFVVNSGNNNIQIIDEKTLSEIDAIQLAEASNAMSIAFENQKIYASSLFGSGVEVRNFEDGTYLKTIKISGGNNGTDAIIAKNGFVYVNRNNYGPDASGKYVFENETILKIDAETDSIVDSVAVGKNVFQMLFDNEGELHVLCKGNYSEFEGEIDIINIDEFKVTDTIALGSQPGNFAMNSQGIIYVAISGMKPDWSGFGGLMKYNSVTNEVLNGVDNLIYNSPDCGILGLCIDGKGNVYAPLFDKNKMLIFENDSLINTIITGNGPQGMVFVPEK